MTIPNDGGVPNWRDPAAYPSPVGRGRMLVWAWEFLRRNHEYRKFWTEKASQIVIEGGIIGSAGSAVLHEAQDRFGIVALPTNPALSARPFFKAVGIRELRSSSDRRPYAINPRIDEIGYLFDLTLPLEGQFARALKSAKNLQQFREDRGEVKWDNPRERSDMYVSYLRILDAEDANVSDRIVADVLFPNLTNNHPDYQRAVALKNQRKPAQRFRDSDYRLLAALAISPSKAK